MIEIGILAVVCIVLVGGGLAIWRLARGPAPRRLVLALRIATLSLIGMLLVATSAWTLSNSRTLQLFGGIVPRVDTAEPIVALTLDDGPSSRFTEEVLTILREQDVRATFFVTGERLARNPGAGQRIVEEGHELGNHSYSHQRMILKPYSFVQQEIERTDQLVRATGYEGDIHFRSPFGKKLIVLPYYLWETGRLNIFWDVAPEAYAEAAVNPDIIVEQVLTETRPGSIVLLHVMAKSRTTSRQALPGIIQGLRAKGYRFVTVSELLATP
jgi:peptidoglycan/xylan/chitin deacetylase (PgdA/CDA1 family)